MLYYSSKHLSRILFRDSPTVSSKASSKASFSASYRE
jgi:hypothetical protein